MILTTAKGSKVNVDRDFSLLAVGKQQAVFQTQTFTTVVI